MKRMIFILASAASAFFGASSFGAEASVNVDPSMRILVYAAKCEKVEIGNPNVVTMSWREGTKYIVNASDFSEGNLIKSEKSEVGVLTTQLKLENFSGQKVIQIFVRYSSNDKTENGTLSLRENYGNNLNAEAGVCESPEDVGNISIKVSTARK